MSNTIDSKYSFTKPYLNETSNYVNKNCSFTAINNNSKDVLEITDNKERELNKFTKFGLFAAATTAAGLALLFGKKKITSNNLRKAVNEAENIVHETKNELKNETTEVLKETEKTVNDIKPNPQVEREALANSGIQVIKDEKCILPITSDEEYNNLLLELNKKKLRQIGPLGDVIGDYYYSLIYLKEDGIQVPQRLKALKMYIGNGSQDAKSHCRELYCDINDFLKTYKGEYIPQLEVGKNVVKNKGLANFDSETGKKVVRCIDYSLKELDKEFGVYEGFVYRNGKMSANGGQYLSTSKSLDCTMGDTSEFHVIKTKHGHKIVDFQRKYYPINQQEEEVLLSRSAKYRELTGVEYEEERMKLARAKYDYLKLTHEDITFEEVLSKTHVWEEI